MMGKYLISMCGILILTFSICPLCYLPERPAQLRSSGQLVEAQRES
jgi:hypothetical protein